MRNLRTFAVCFLGAIAMAACAGSESIEGNKNTLTEKGYTVSVYSAEEYKTQPVAKIFSEPTGLTNHLVAAKTTQEKNYVFAAWYFASIDQANNWEKANEAKLASFYSETAGTTLGQRNNVVWIGTGETADILGWRTI